MDVMEKLVELIHKAKLSMWGKNGLSKEKAQNSYIADYLISNGVTVQEWISVDDRLPEPKEKAICIDADGDIIIGTYTEWGWMFPCYFKRPTHWMPIPQPPKGE